MGVLGASGNALYCWPVSVAPTPDTAPNGLSSPPCWGRFFELSFYKGRRLEWSVLSRSLPAGLAHAQLQTLQCRSPRRILLEFLGCSINLADDMFCRWRDEFV